MDAKKFSRDEAIRFGWDTMKNNLIFFIGLLIVTGLIYFVPDQISESIKKNFPVLSVILSVAAWIMQMIVSIGLINISLKFCDNQNANLRDLFFCANLFFKYLLGFLAYGLIMLGVILPIVILGIILFLFFKSLIAPILFIPVLAIIAILLVVPLVIKFQFFSYFIVDKNLGPIEALKKSAIITKGSKWDLFILGVVFGGINLLGALALLIGLFATIPATMVANAFVYRKLLVQSELPGQIDSTHGVA